MARPASSPFADETPSITDRESGWGLPTPRWPWLLAGALLTCVLALYNGFPLAYSDTGNYLDNALDLLHLRRPWFFFRPLTYGVFLIPFASPATIRLLPLAQGILVAGSVALALRTAGLRLTEGAFVALLTGLSLLTSLPWFSGQIMPDVFTPVVILLGFVILWLPALAGARLRWTAAAILALAVATHLTHFPLYAGVLAAGLILRLAMDRDVRTWRAGGTLLAWGLAPLLVALLAVVGPNYLLYGRAVLSRSSQIFALGHLIGDGAAQRYLERACPTRGYALCAERSRLRADVDWFLWDAGGPRARAERAMARGDSTFLREAPLIVSGTLRQEWPAVLASSLRASAAQLVTFGLHRGELTYSASVAASMRRLAPSVEAAYAGSRQARHALPIDIASRVQYVVVCAGALALLIALPRLRGPAHRPFRGLVGMVVVGLVANAAILASLSTVHPRYQSRVVWLVPLLGAAAVLRARERRATF